MLPFTALVGLESAQHALLLLAVEPQLRGVVVSATVGTGKSSLARGFTAVLDGAISHQQPTPNPFVELPLGADDEALLGGLDLEATLRQSKRVARPGLLARADQGTIYVDGINLLADSAANVLLAALENRIVRVEREGLSLITATRFSLIGTYDPAEGAPRRHLLDRVGLLVTLPQASGVQERAEVVRRNQHSPTPHSSFSDWADETDLLCATIAAAREVLPDVQISDEQIEQLVAAAEAFGVEGHRADRFAVRAARASAALALREEVDQSDLETAVRLVILPRATRIPEPPAEQPLPPPDQPPQQEQPSPPESEDDSGETPEQQSQAIPEEQVLTALATELPTELDQMPFRAVRRGRSGSRGSTNGKRGKHIRSIPGDVRRNRIDISATLRAAAPWQAIRVAAVREPPTSHPPLALRAEDLRIKQYRSKAGALFLFAVDASGSMALHRMRQAKGAVHALLQRAYVQRDRVALLAFRGQSAEILLPPSQSVELARRALDTLPTGGGTPIAAALLAAIEVAAQARSRGILQTVLVLLTDGRANIGLKAARTEIPTEIQALGRHVIEAGIRTIVVDTQRNYLSRGEARNLAAWLGGEYVYLPNAQGEQIAEAAMQARDG